ncbi:hypothetical protein JHK87_024840 [Glycine soja]|nr:hypothetical protein JHK87_024840 [Glycine soja]
MQTIQHSAYGQDPYAKEFGIRISEKLAFELNREPVIPIYNAKPKHVEKALKHVYHVSTNKTKGKELEFLLAILPGKNGSLYGPFFRDCSQVSKLGVV